MRFLITMGKLKNYDTLYFEHIVYQVLNHLKNLFGQSPFLD